MPFGFAVPFPATAAQVQVIRDGQVVAKAFVATQLLRTAVASLPDSAFVKDPAQRRQALENMVDAFNHQLAAGAFPGRDRKLVHAILGRLTHWARLRSRNLSPRQYTKPARLFHLGE